MEWVLDHLQVLFVIAVAVVAILQKLKTARPADDGSPAADSEQAERTRRIQEEIRRRIMERRGVPPVSPPEAEPADEDLPFPEAPPMIEEVRRVVVPPPLEQTAAAPLATESLSESDRRQQVLQQFREVQAAQAAGRDGSPATESMSEANRQQQIVQQFREGQAAQAAGRDSAPARASINSRSLDLRDPSSLRRAVVLREILGPPVGMR